MVLKKLEKNKPVNGEKKTILIFCAHSDDETLGAGGFIKKASDLGYEIVTIIFSLGEKGSIILNEDYLIKKRIEEARSVSQILGSKALFLGLRDSHLTEDVKLPWVYRSIKRNIEHFDPELILFHSKDDRIFPDHLAVYKIVSKVLSDMDYKNAFTFNIWNPINFFEIFNPSIVVDISDVLKTKLKALKEFKTQKTAVYQLIPLVLIKAAVYGISRGTKFAEVFYRWN